ncbi:FG-GAP-like repeat-containing protein [Stieleria sp.]|uniref:FG-GAP-like repeat-containing protein n=1 Tax=Stieleria sp. TaxID=2795976 RepID=UPI0035634211
MKQHARTNRLRSRDRVHPRRRRLCGEVLERRDLLASDFGDAPAPYPTTLAADGARHIATGPTLGFQRDTEAEGVPSVVAQSDGADEDGVTIGSLRVGQVGASLIVNVQGGPAKLDAWIDFNRNGRWDGGSEKIASSVSLVSGFSTLNFDVPIDAKPGLSFARFRLSTAGGLSVIGEAADGEVEDYPLTIGGLAATDVVLPHELIGVAGTPEIAAFTTSDIDGDGDVDLIATSPATNQLLYFENDGGERFEQHVIDQVNATEIVASDLDRDGDTDIVIAQGAGDRVVSWYENTSPGVFVARSINNRFSSFGVTTLDVGDIDGDGDIDIAFGVPRDDSVYWFANRGDMNFDFRSTSTFGFIADTPRDLTLVDFEGDGDLDIFVSDETANDSTGIVYFENLGASGFGIDSLGGVANRTFVSFDVSDIDGDGDLDLLTGASTGTIEWFENRGTGVWFDGGTIRSAGNPVGTVQTGDLDGDGDFDVAATLVDDDQVVWYRNDGAENFTEVLVRSIDAPNPIAIVDLDQDGDLDVVTASAGDDGFVWHRNINAPDFGDAPAPYPTLLADRGAYHVAAGPRLGATRDVETDGMPSPNADGDGPDEDGVLFGDIEPGQMAGFNIDLQNASSGKVTAWIDWDDDGIWETDERIRTGADVIPGLQTFNYNVPADVQPGRRMARVRLASEAITDPTGYAADGEVEDYQIAIGGDVEVVLPDSLSSDVYVELSGSDLQVVSYTLPTQIFSSTPLATTRSLSIQMGAFDNGTYRSRVVVDFRDGFFSLPGGILIEGQWVNGIPQSRQNVEIIGTGATNAVYRTENLPLGNGRFEVEQGGIPSVIRLKEINDVRINQMVQITIDGDLELRFNELYLDADDPIALGPVTKFTGGQLDTLHSTSPIVFGGDLIVDVVYRGGIKVGAFADLFFAPSYSGDFSSRTYQDHPLGTEWGIRTDEAFFYTLQLFDVAQVGGVVLNNRPDDTQRSTVTEVNVEIEGYVEIDPGAFQVRKRGTGGGLVDHSVTVATVQGNTVATLAFSGAMTRGANHALVDGNYDLTIDPTKVRRRRSTVILDGDGDQLSGGTFEFGVAETDGFFALYGDSDGDRDVDGQDYGRFGLTFLKSQNDPLFNSAFDSDGDGDVDGQDYGRFGQRFLTTLPFD